MTIEDDIELRDGRLRFCSQRLSPTKQFAEQRKASIAWAIQNVQADDQSGDTR
ncbi:hypothetical protein DSM3645_12561 [Blastopirellula marina DSM 3645]|uniref:Uncharacterized protein n=1 Tax=Blastopirellula marina DSM 3645 TaxID=314230 RepID=A3ZRT2_9BACT|nr:hypothetical protein DSM3645_12561 [Blastopirellula marina DSM 3645]